MTCFALGSLCALALMACAAPPDPLPPPAADHHVHIRSESGGEVLPRAQLIRGKRPQDLVRGKQGAEELIAQLDRHGIQQAAILSLAYMYAIPELEFSDEYGMVRAENDFVATQAARFPGRLSAFCGVSPVRDYAEAEVRRCAEELQATGIKMHMANSDIDLLQADEAAATARIFEKANQHGLAVIIHLRPRGRSFGKEQAQVFLEELMPRAPDVPVQLAHLASGGVIDRPALKAGQHIAAALPEHDNLWFDVSGIFVRSRDLTSDTAGRRAGYSKRRNAVELIQAVGPERLLFGSDWDALRYEDTLRPLQQGRGLRRSQLRQILANRAPYLPD